MPEHLANRGTRYGSRDVRVPAGKLCSGIFMILQGTERPWDSEYQGEDALPRSLGFSARETN